MVSFFFQLLIAGFGFFYTHRLIAYGLLATLAEINSVFLHGRQLLLMYGFAKTSVAFRVNNLVNVVTYIIMRLGSLSVLIYFILQDSSDDGGLSPVWSKLMLLIGGVVLVINVILFYRLLKSDFLSSSSSSSASSAKRNNTGGGTNDGDILIGDINSNEKSR